VDALLPNTLKRESRFGVLGIWWGILTPQQIHTVSVFVIFQHMSGALLGNTLKLDSRFGVFRVMARHFYVAIYTRCICLRY